ncbi:Lipoyl synthase [Anaplasma phagocytophilum]|uniref:hypothetical protein n=1 Tax=Anaplasma phagocytophilum TaxID=948 RepID=UPI0007DFDEBB|nr:hypothetical protein [Anaplasma phagocytophilum]SCV65180.1 Lipoyl synthase [Anaplasma phagocytophilum]SCV65667.1 Lipoyl synthase [Anaplasma phagocytophilum]
METVPRLYARVRPRAKYFYSLQLLQQVKDKSQDMFTKSGLMLVLGEQKEELRCVRGLTFCLGAVLAKDNIDMNRYVTPE